MNVRLRPRRCSRRRSRAAARTAPDGLVVADDRGADRLDERARAGCGQRRPAGGGARPRVGSPGVLRRGVSAGAAFRRARRRAATSAPRPGVAAGAARCCLQAIVERPTGLMSTRRAAPPYPRAHATTHRHRRTAPAWHPPSRPSARRRGPEAFPPDVLAEAERGGRAPRLPATDLERHPVRDARPAGSHGPGPGLPPRAARRRRLPGALRDRGRGALSSRPAARSTPRRARASRRSTAPTAGSRSTRRSCPRAPPRCCPTARAGGGLDDRCRRAPGRRRAIDVRRAMVRSRARLDYPAAQAAIEAGHRGGPGRRCSGRSASCSIAAEHARGGMTLRVPSQEVDGRCPTAACR